MLVLNLPYLTKTKTGVYGYRRRVPDCIRHIVGSGEIVKSFKTSDPKLVKPAHAAFHAEVERTFAQAKTSTGISADFVFEAAVRSLRARGVPTIDVAQGEWTADDGSDALDVVLADAG